MLRYFVSINVSINYCKLEQFKYDNTIDYNDEQEKLQV